MEQFFYQCEKNGCFLEQYIYHIGSYHYNWHRELELMTVLRGELEGFRCDDACIRRTIDELYERHGYFSDPHSAVGYAASMAIGKPGFYLSTAHPAKFGEVISPVTGAKVPLPPRLAELVKRPRVSEPMAVDLGALEEYVAGV